MKNVLFLLLAVSTFAAGAQLAPNAPQDKPQSITEDQKAAFERAIAPHIAKAKATYPDAKKRFLVGLPPKHTFFITTRLYDKSGIWEQVFIGVESIKGDKVTGLIRSDLNQVTEFKTGQRYTFSESAMLDWLISKPDGSEEGNFVGKFLDTYRP